MTNDLKKLQNKRNPSEGLLEEGIRKHVPTEDIEGVDEEKHSATDPTFDDDVGKMVEDFTGEEPEQGNPRTVADMVNDAERNRRIGPDDKK